MSERRANASEGQVLWELLDSHAQMTADVIRLLIASTTFALVLDIIFAEPVPPLMYIAFFSPFLGTYIGGYVLLRQGKLRGATLLVTLGTVVGQVSIGYYVQGHEAQAMVSFVNLVLITGFVLGPVAALITSVVASGAVTSYFLLDAAGNLPEPELLTGPKAGAIALGTTLFTTGGLVFIAIRHVRSALLQERSASAQIRQALEAKERATFALDHRAQLAEELVRISRKLIETGQPSELAERLCRTLCDALDLDGVWLVGRGGALMGCAARHREGGGALSCGETRSFPLPLDEADRIAVASAEQRHALAAWSGSTQLDECVIVLVASNPQVFLVAAGPVDSCESEAALSFYSAAAGLFASGLARTSAEARLRQAQRMDAVGRLSAGLAHDFNNLLTAIVAGTELVKSRLKRDQDVDAQVQAIEQATERAANLTQRLMAFTAAEQRPPEAVELTDLVRGMLNVLKRTIEARIELSAAIDDAPMWIQADPVEVERAVMNLVLNARDAIKARGSVRVSVRTSDEVLGAASERTPVALLTVEDDGEGMSAEVERRIFEPFFTTRGEHGGHGLGLSAVYGLAKSAGGRVDVRSRPGEGATFTLSLPRVSAPDVHEQVTESFQDLAGNSFCVLVVEDSEDVRSLLSEVLEDAGYRVLTAVDGVGALAVLESDQNIQLVVSDVMMPNLDGIELATELSKRQPDLPVILMSGYAPSHTELEGVKQLHKPFSIDTLLALVENSLAEVRAT